MDKQPSFSQQQRDNDRLWDMLKRADGLVIVLDHDEKPWSVDGWLVTIGTVPVEDDGQPNLVSIGRLMECAARSDRNVWWWFGYRDGKERVFIEKKLNFDLERSVREMFYGLSMDQGYSMEHRKLPFGADALRIKIVR